MDKSLQEKLQMIAEMKDPSLKMARILADKAVAEAVAKLDFNTVIAKGEKGDKGDAGEQGQMGPQGEQGLSGIDGVDGMDGFDGLDGKDGETPIKGFHYWTPEDQKQIVSEAAKMVPAGKDGISPDINDLISRTLAEVKKAPVDFKNITGTEKLVEYLKLGGFRGGGLSEVFHDATLTGDGTQLNPLSVVGAGAGVTSLNTLTGAVILAAGTGITITPAGNTLTIASTGGGTITGGGSATQIAYWNGATSITGNNGLWFDVSAVRFGVGTATPSFTGDFQGTQSFGSPQFTGSGLNDLSVSGTPSGTRSHVYFIFINSTGIPDTYFVAKDGTNITGTLNMVVGPVLIDDGFSITWGATTGHTGGDSWTVAVNCTGQINTTSSLLFNGIMGITQDGNNNLAWGNNAGNLLDTSVVSGNINIGANAGGQSYGGNNNINIGAITGLNISGNGNTSVGVNSIMNATTASGNSIFGSNAGNGITNGVSNAVFGYQANAGGNGNQNVYIGAVAGFGANSNNSVCIGFGSGQSLATPNAVFIGVNTGRVVTSGAQNTFVGSFSGTSVTTHDRNAFFGYNAGVNTDSDANTFLGNESGISNTSGIQNVYVGNQTGTNATASNNVIVGSNGGTVLSTGSENVLIGSGANVATGGTFGAKAIGYGAIADSNEFVSGSPQEFTTNVYFGSGTTAAASTAGTTYTIHGSGGGNTTNDQAGGNIILSAGKSTGAAVPASVIIQTTTVAASSTTPQALSDIHEWNSTKSWSKKGQRDNIRVVTVAGAIAVVTTDYIIVQNKAAPAATIVNLPAGPNAGDTYVIKDGKGNANVFNMTVTPAAGTIDGAGTYVMNINYQANTFVYNGTEWNVI